MTNNIIKEFKQILNETDWMDENSKKAAMDKANALNPQIGYPDQYFDDKYLEDLYGVIHFLDLIICKIFLKSI